MSGASMQMKQRKNRNQAKSPGKAGIRLYTSAEVANRLRVSKMTALRWVSDGKVKSPTLFTLSARRTVWLWTNEESRSIVCPKRRAPGSTRVT
jgi:hypothetical protein